MKDISANITFCIALNNLVVPLDRPRWKSAPKHVAVDLGDEAILRCEVDSNPDAEVLWQRADKLIKNSKTLIIPQVAPDDLGAYTCIAQVHCCGFPKVEQDIQVLQKGGITVYDNQFSM